MQDIVEFSQKLINDKKKSLQTKYSCFKKSLQRLEVFKKENEKPVQYCEDDSDVMKDDLEEHRKTIDKCQQKVGEIAEKYKNLETIEVELHEQVELVHQQVELLRVRLRKGLTPARIQQFHQFPADGSLDGEKCTVCQYDIEVGSRITRLDCDGQHVFCQDCAESWFADHNTCPNCRHVFK